MDVLLICPAMIDGEENTVLEDTQAQLVSDESERKVETEEIQSEHHSLTDYRQPSWIYNGAI